MGVSGSSSAGGCSGRSSSSAPVIQSITLATVREVTLKRAETDRRNGSNAVVSKPTGPSHRSWAVEIVNPGRRSLVNRLVIDWVVHPLRPGSLACSKSYVRFDVWMLRTLSLRCGRVPVVSSSARRRLASKVWDSEMLSVWTARLSNWGLFPVGSMARANASGTEADGA